ncbi:MAG TPA: nucleotide kinase domain-containing protein [Candidatus Elarobacter sp.]|nr:nucleotide kinase domain-containing protein [Candidatus Elarobacter sp.]
MTEYYALGASRPESRKLPVSQPLVPALVSDLYDVYWLFAAERHNVFIRRLRSLPPPWTADPILLTFKFTNAYRVLDRVSQYLIRSVIYRADLPDTSAEICFRILLFKIFNKIETWQRLERAFGSITLAGYDFYKYDEAFKSALAAGDPIYSGAYIMPPGGSSYGFSAKHQNHLRLIEAIITSGFPDRIRHCRTMQQVFLLLRGFPTIGDFLAYQLTTDINYSTLTNFAEMDFVVPGPGARDGIRKCFTHSGGLNDAELIKIVADRQESELARLGLSFPSLWGRRLQLIDCQNLFCEVSKYTRVAYPSAKGLAGRTKIKQRFRAGRDMYNVWLPPKWGLNERIAADPHLTARY